MVHKRIFDAVLPTLALFGHDEMPRQSPLCDYERTSVGGRAELQSHCCKSEKWVNIFLQVDGVCLGFSQVSRATSRQLLEEVGVLKSLERLSFGPVVLIHVHRVGIKYKKPPEPTLTN